MLTGLERFYRRIMPILGALQADAQLREMLASRGGEIGPHLALGAVAEALGEHFPDHPDPLAAAVLLIGAAYQRALHTHLLGDGASRFLPPAESVARTLLPSFP